MDTKLNSLLLKARKSHTSSFSVKDMAAVLTATGFASEVVYGEKRRIDGIKVMAAPMGSNVLQAVEVQRPVNYNCLPDYVILGDLEERLGAGWRSLFLSRVSELLGMETYEMEQKDKEVYGARHDVTNTGTCAVCFSHQKLELYSAGSRAAGTMVRHGYQRPGHGTIFNDCDGTGLPPIEVSPEGVSLVKRSLTITAGLIREAIATLESGGSVTVDLGRTMREVKLVTYRLGDVGYEEARAKQLETKRRGLETTVARRDARAALEAAWESDDLPEVRLKRPLKLIGLIRACY